MVLSQVMTMIIIRIAIIASIIHPLCLPIHYCRCHDTLEVYPAGISLDVKRGGWPLRTEQCHRKNQALGYGTGLLWVTVLINSLIKVGEVIPSLLMPNAICDVDVDVDVD